MSDTPDYSSYHLHELEAALREIDETERPEEARLIRETIAKGGYVYPTAPPVTGVRFGKKGGRSIFRSMRVFK
jgi:guanyl-specific ribonuclease Sa